LYICCYFLDESSFTFLLFRLPISHYYLSLSLVLSVLLIFSLILFSIKMVWFYFRTSHSSHITNTPAVSSIYKYMISLVTYIFVRWSPGGLFNILILVPCSCHSKIFSHCKIYHSFSIIICYVVMDVPSMCYTLLQLYLWSPLIQFPCRSWELHHTASPTN